MPPTQTIPSANDAAADGAAVGRPSPKGVTQADRYVAERRLSAAVRQLAAEELRETEAVRTQALRAMREWIEQNPRLMRVRLGERPRP